MWENTVAIHSILKEKNYKMKFLTSSILKKVKLTKIIKKTKKNEKMQKTKQKNDRKKWKIRKEKVQKKWKTRRKKKNAINPHWSGCGCSGYEWIVNSSHLLNYYFIYRKFFLCVKILKKKLIEFFYKRKKKNNKVCVGARVECPGNTCIHEWLEICGGARANSFLLISFSDISFLNLFFN